MYHVGEDTILPHAMITDQHLDKKIINRLRNGSSRTPTPTGVVDAGRMTDSGYPAAKKAESFVLSAFSLILPT